jgi:hypothetical protein
MTTAVGSEMVDLDILPLQLSDKVYQRPLRSSDRILASLDGQLVNLARILTTRNPTARMQTLHTETRDSSYLQTDTPLLGAVE